MVLVPAMMTLGLSAPQAVAATNNPSYCIGGLQKIDNSFGTKVPVILVHGYRGGPAQWKKADGSNIYESINKLPNTKVALNFNYGSFWFVDDGTQGEYLGKSIDCVSQISKMNGGSGKVILIGYSLGAVIAQVALNKEYSSGNPVANDVGQFITIANANSVVPVVTPPSGVLIHAIAGDIVKQYVKTGVVKSSVDTQSDSVVSVAGATSQKSGELSMGGGESVFTCHSKYSDENYKTMTNNAPCRHSELLKYAPVQKDVITAITNYVSSLLPIVSQPNTIHVGSLTMPRPSQWVTTAPYESSTCDDGADSCMLFDTTNSIDFRVYAAPDPTYAYVGVYYQPTYTVDFVNQHIFDPSGGGVPIKSIGG